MIASTTQLHDKFLSILPTIEAQAKFAFRKFPRHEREEVVAEVVAHSWAAFVRLIGRGKDPMTFPTVLAKYSISSVKAGKLVGCRCNRKDLASPFRKKPEGFRIVSIESAPNSRAPAWREILVEDKLATPAEIAASRIDFSNWLKLQNHRNRRIAESLAEGNRTLDVARRFRVSQGRISQIRDEFRQSWKEFHGEVHEQCPSVESAVA